MSTTKPYVLAIDRPVDGRRRKAGETVHLTAKQYEAEKVWGGLESAETAPALPEILGGEVGLVPDAGDPPADPPGGKPPKPGRKLS